MKKRILKVCPDCGKELSRKRISPIKEMVYCPDPSCYFEQVVRVRQKITKWDRKSIDR